MPPVISVENLAKKYILNHQRQGQISLRDMLADGAKRMGARLLSPFTHHHSPITDPTHEEFWALKDVSFDIRQGDRVGIIGRNGAGKSTLLKILSRITEPTSGRVSIKGRVASLLEVGTGFHPELSGRENIFLNGAILGMSRADIARKFDEIVAFAEVEKFLDTPVKHYSSGMYMRLAFAVAAHLEPEILIVDEVLAVGDANFQKKCMGKMNEVGTEGRTVLFVSHNLASINALCNQAVMLDKGHVSAKGEVDAVIIKYRQDGTANKGSVFVNKSEGAGAKALVLEACVRGSNNQPCALLPIDQVSSIQIIWALRIKVSFLRIGVEVMDSAGVIVLSSMDTDSTGMHGKPRKPGIYREIMEMPPFLLMPGVYTVKVFVGIPGVERILESNEILEFEVAEHQTHLSHVPGARRAGYIAAPLQWRINFEYAE